MNYADPADLYAYGLPRGAAPNQGRPLAAANTSANTLTLDVHGFALNDPITFRVEGGGTIPAPLVEGTTYFAKPVSESTFQVAAAADGAAIDISAAGTPNRVLAMAALPIDACLQWASRLIDDMLPAHVVPLESPVPEIVRIACAELAAGKLLTLQGTASASSSAMVAETRKHLERWARGVPIRGDGAQQSAGAAASVSIASAAADSRGWGRFGGLEHGPKG